MWDVVAYVTAAYLIDDISLTHLLPGAALLLAQHESLRLAFRPRQAAVKPASKDPLLRIEPGFELDPEMDEEELGPDGEPISRRTLTLSSERDGLPMWRASLRDVLEVLLQLLGAVQLRASRCCHDRVRERSARRRDGNALPRSARLPAPRRLRLPPSPPSPRRPPQLRARAAVPLSAARCRRVCTGNTSDPLPLPSPPSPSPSPLPLLSPPPPPRVPPLSPPRPHVALGPPPPPPGPPPRPSHPPRRAPRRSRSSGASPAALRGDHALPPRRLLPAGRPPLPPHLLRPPRRHRAADAEDLRRRPTRTTRGVATTGRRWGGVGRRASCQASAPRWHATPSRCCPSVSTSPRRRSGRAPTRAALASLAGARALRHARDAVASSSCCSPATRRRRASPSAASRCCRHCSADASSRPREGQGDRPAFGMFSCRLAASTCWGLAVLLATAQLAPHLSSLAPAAPAARLVPPSSPSCSVGAARGGALRRLQALRRRPRRALRQCELAARRRCVARREPPAA